MKNRIKKLIAAALTLMTLSAPIMSPQIFPQSSTIIASARENKTHSYTYKGVTCKYQELGLSGKKVKVVSVVTSKPTKLEIPKEIRLPLSNGSTDVKPVVEIGEGFAANLTTLTTLTIPESIEKMGKGVAKGCTKLSEVNLKTKKLTEMDAGFLDGTKYVNDCLNSTQSVCVGEWLLRYNPKDNKQMVVVYALSGSETSPSDDAPPVTKIASGAFQNCPKLTWVSLEKVTHICENAFGKGSKVSKFTDTGSVQWVKTTSINKTPWYDNAVNISYGNPRENIELIWGKTLFYYNMENTTKTVDFSAKKYNGITTITYPLLKYEEYTLPRMVKKFDMGIINPSLTKLNYWNTNTTTSGKYVDLKTVISDYVNNGKSLTAVDKAFLDNNARVLTHGESSVTYIRYSGYMGEILLMLGKKFLKDSGIDPSKTVTSTTDAWTQYEIIRKLDISFREKIPYNYADTGGSGNYAAELLINKGIVCQDFAHLFKYLLGIVGMDARFIRSKDHAWNVVKVHDSATGKDHWFNIDTTTGWNGNLNLFLTPDSTFEEDESDRFHDRDSDITEPKGLEMRGDIDGDKRITIEDAQLVQIAATNIVALKKNIGLTPYQQFLADVDADGKITLEDAQYLQRYSVDHTVSGKYKKSLESYIKSMKRQVSFPKKS